MNNATPKKPLRLLFMGTAAFAVPSLAALQAAGHNIVGVFTVPDKPQGRGQRLHPSPIKQYAQAHGLPLYQPPQLRAPEVQALLEKLRPDLQLVVAFRKIPRAVWAFPPMGSINLHASLLPAYRGAAPIHWALIHGKQKTGLSTFFIREEIDEGPLLLQEEVAIAPDDSAGSLHERMSQQGADLLLRTVSELSTGELHPRPQPPAPPKCPRAPKLQRSHCQINWEQPAEDIQCFVKGLAPTPGAWTLFQDQPCKIFQLRPTEIPSLKAGTHQINKKGLFFGTNTAPLSVEVLQMPGKKRLPIAAFIRGLHL